MNRTSLRIALLVLTTLPMAMPAQTAAPADKATPTAAEFTTDQSALQPKKERAISKSLSSALSAGIKYEPPPPPKPAAEEVDLREIDKPRNDIIRLPKYVVEAQRPPIFNDRNLYSKEMLRRLAYQRYASSFSSNFLNKYRLPIIGGGLESYVMMMYEADERKANMAEMDDKVSMYRVSGDDASADALKDDSQRTFMRRTEYSTTPGTTK
jgi:hypothetical protein